MKKAVLIDVEKSEIREVELKGNLDDYYRFIKCDLITSVSVPNNEDHDVIVDDEGLLKPFKGLFSIDDENEPQFAGNGLIMRVNEDSGNWITSKLSVDEVRKRVTFWKVFYTTAGRIIVRVPKNEE